MRGLENEMSCSHKAHVSASIKKYLFDEDSMLEADPPSKPERHSIALVFADKAFIHVHIAQHDTAIVLPFIIVMMVSLQSIMVTVTPC
ncbi:unnamed protein product [Angiostrongylus costaricensis]|uniref:Uncharacterized protein n=1 Tax=Angiostrongylus costaricensis TaxID=334426 RepID=A0A0R3Q0B3_ANGCS|nr:unnamed protein product [Angiostrongylus costaricensis]